MWTVTEETPVPKAATDPASDDPLEGIPSFLTGRWFDEDSDPRPISLKIDPDSLVVHHVTSVRFTTSKTPVQRTRRVKTKPEF